jgi:mono/diheme cytochrome c family protein
MRRGISRGNTVEQRELKRRFEKIRLGEAKVRPMCVRGATGTGMRGAVLAVAVALAGCRSTPPPTPLSELTPQQTAGHVVFETRCAVCHYDRQSGTLHGPSLLGLYKKPALPSGAAPTDERVTATILHGRNQMPAMGGQLDDESLSDLIAYLHTL